MKPLRDYMLDPPDPGPDPICPVCHEYCETVYRSELTAEIIGCDNCVMEYSAAETSECYSE